jgi:tetratricopeptide (TPR) repeat protein
MNDIKKYKLIMRILFVSLYLTTFLYIILIYVYHYQEACLLGLLTALYGYIYQKIMDKYIGNLTNQFLKLCQEHKYEEAIYISDKLYKFDSEYYPLSLFRQALLFFNLNNNQQVIAICNLILTKKKQDRFYRAIYFGLSCELQYLQGLALARLECYHEALFNYEEALKFNFQSFFYKLEKKMRNYWQNQEQKHPDTFLNVYEPYFIFQQEKFTQPQIWNSRGLALAHLGRYVEAIDSYDRALKSQPNFGEAFYNKACTYALMGEVRLALDSLQQAIYINPQLYIQQARQESQLDSLKNLQEFVGIIKKIQ